MVPGSPRLGPRWPGYFGPPERRLFGCYHPPQGADDRDVIVELCYPLGQEYTYSHRAYLHLANRLAQAGFHVGRFDYFGTGDSAGDEDDQTIGDWVGDVAAAVTEGRQLTRRRHLALVGLRFGATLAMLAAMARSDAAALVLWDPVINGGAYLEQLRVQHQEALWTLFFDRPPLEQADERPAELLGFRFNPRLYDEIAALDLATIATRPARSALLVDSRDDPEVTRLRDHLQGLGVQVTYRHMPGFSIWTEDPDKGLVPTQVIQEIVSWLSELPLL